MNKEKKIINIKTGLNFKVYGLRLWIKTWLSPLFLDIGLEFNISVGTEERDRDIRKKEKK